MALCGCRGDISSPRSACSGRQVTPNLKTPPLPARTPALCCKPHTSLALPATRRCCFAPAAAIHRFPAAAAAFSATIPASNVCAPESEAAVSDKYRGLSPPALFQAFDAEHPGLLEAVAHATEGMTPASAAQLLRTLEAELPPALTDVAPGGDCVLVAIEPGLLPLLERAAYCCETSLQSNQPVEAAVTARAALSFISCLQFGRRESAVPYATLAVRCKRALKDAYDAGADIIEQDAVEMEAVCARASSWLWLTPYFGHRYADVVDGFVTEGWSSAELAVQYVEAYTALLGRGCYQLVERKYVRVMRAAMNQRLSLDQTGRLLAAIDQLPSDISIQLALYARSLGNGGADWHSQLQRMHKEREQEQLQRHSLQHALPNRGNVASTRQQAERAALPCVRLVHASRAQRN